MLGLLKKKQRQVNIELRCPAEGCSFNCYDHISLNRHIGWKHPELAGSDAKTSEKVK